MALKVYQVIDLIHSTEIQQKIKGDLVLARMCREIFNVMYRLHGDEFDAEAHPLVVEKYHEVRKQSGVDGEPLPLAEVEHLEFEEVAPESSNRPQQDEYLKKAWKWPP